MSPEPHEEPNAHLTSRLPAGRQLGYSDTGPPDAFPVLYFHGFPGSRLEATFFPVRSIRLIGVDRPGYGLSTPRPFRRLADWPADVEALADRLAIGRFGLIGVSGGAPYAAAVAHALGERVSALALICGLGPPEAPGMTEGRLLALANMGRRPFWRLFAAALGRQIVLNDRAFERLRVRRARMPRPEGDRQLFEGPLAGLMTRSWREGLSRSSLGMAADARIYAEPWPFDLSDLKVPTGVWHGRVDSIVPVSIGEHYACSIPGAVGRFPFSDGHFSVVINSLDEVVSFILANR